jgi:hypothetical protein
VANVWHGMMHWRFWRFQGPEGDLPFLGFCARLYAPPMAEPSNGPRHPPPRALNTAIWSCTNAESEVATAASAATWRLRGYSGGEGQ